MYHGGFRSGSDRDTGFPHGGLGGGLLLIDRLGATVIQLGNLVWYPTLRFRFRALFPTKSFSITESGVFLIEWSNFTLSYIIL